MTVKPIPDGYHTVTPYLIVKNAAGALEFYKKALGYQELFRMPMPDGRVGHAEIQIGDSRIMLADEFPDMGGEVSADAGRLAGGQLPVRRGRGCWRFDRAVARPKLHGAAAGEGPVLRRPVRVLEWIPFGHVWTVATHKEDLSPEEECTDARSVHETTKAAADNRPRRRAAGRPSRSPGAHQDALQGRRSHGGNAEEKSRSARRDADVRQGPARTRGGSAAITFGRGTFQPGWALVHVGATRRQDEEL